MRGGVGANGNNSLRRNTLYPWPRCGVSPGLSGTLTISYNTPSHGIVVGLQGILGLSGQVAYSFESESFFGEVGLGQPGIALTGTYCFGPLGNPMGRK